MKKGNYILILAVSVISGLIGGLISNQLFNTKDAYAQETKEPLAIVEAQEFHLVNKQGKVFAALAISSQNNEPFLIINGQDGKHRMMFNIDKGSPQIILKDNDAQTRMILGMSEVASKFRDTVEKRPESSIVMFNKDGKLIWSAP